MPASFDVIVIGSGMGGLTVASLLAQIHHQRVLVLERHFRAGGYTHSFQRHGFHWDVGLHYVGQMQPGSPLRRLMDRVTQQSVEWRRMAEPFERFCFPGFSFDWRGEPQAMEQELCKRFPDEAAAIHRYRKHQARASRWLEMEMMRRNGAAIARWTAAAVQPCLPFPIGITTGQYLNQHFRNPQLKAILAAQWGTYGLPPSRSPFPLHAMITRHYQEGGWYPEGGAQQIATAVRKTVESRGGLFLIGREVQHVNTLDGVATGVTLQLTGRSNPAEPIEFTAPVVISDAGVPNTYLRLVTEAIPFREELQNFLAAEDPVTAVCLYAGLKGNPQNLGFHGENYWLYDDVDHDACFQRTRNWVNNSQPPQLYLSFPSLKDPRAEKHTAELMCFAPYSVFAPWAQQPWLRRDDTYQQWKREISQRILQMADQHLPGFSGMVEYHELSTPLTNESLAGHPQGAIYGLPNVADRYGRPGQRWTSPRSPIPGLYLTGSDVACPGIAGAMMGGVTTLSVLPNPIPTPLLFR